MKIISHTKKIYSGTNTVNIPARSEVIEGANEGNDEAEAALTDKIKSAEADFDYIIDGLEQLDLVEANALINQIHESLQEFIQDIATQLS